MRPPSFDESALAEHVRSVLLRAFPVRAERAEIAPSADPDGPVRIDDAQILARLVLSDARGPTALTLPVCDRTERDLRLPSAAVEGLASALQRLIADERSERELGQWPIERAMRALLDTARERRSTPEDCERILLRSKSLRRLLSPSPDAVRTATEALTAWLAAHKTLASAPCVRLQIVEHQGPDGPSFAIELGPEGLNVGLWLIHTEKDGMICNVKEQPVLFAPSHALDDLDRVIALLDGLVRVLPAYLERLGESSEAMMPHELIDASALDLVRPRSAEDFAEVFTRRWLK